MRVEHVGLFFTVSNNFTIYFKSLYSIIVLPQFLNKAPKLLEEHPSSELVVMSLDIDRLPLYFFSACGIVMHAIPFQPYKTAAVPAVYRLQTYVHAEDCMCKLRSYT